MWKKGYYEYQGSFNILFSLLLGRGCPICEQDEGGSPEEQGLRGWKRKSGPLLVRAVHFLVLLVFRDSLLHRTTKETTRPAFSGFSLSDFLPTGFDMMVSRHYARKVS